MKTIKAIRITEENFEFMGQVIQIPKEGERAPHLEGDGFKHYGELAIQDCHGPIEFGITKFDKREMVVDRLEQHAKTPELLLALDGPFLMPVAPKIVVDGKEAPDLDKLFAIHVDTAEGVIFKDGYWHLAPFPLKEQSSVLVGFKPRSWADDIIFFDLPEPVEVVL